MQTFKTVIKKFDTGHVELNLMLEGVFQSAIHASTDEAEALVAEEIVAIQSLAIPLDAAYLLCEALDEWYALMYRNAQQHPLNPDSDKELIDCIISVIRIRFWLDNGMGPYETLHYFLSVDEIMLKLNAFVVPDVEFDSNQSICGVYELPQPLDEDDDLTDSGLIVL